MFDSRTVLDGRISVCISRGCYIHAMRGALFAWDFAMNCFGLCEHLRLPDQPLILRLRDEARCSFQCAFELRAKFKVRKNNNLLRLLWKCCHFALVFWRKIFTLCNISNHKRDFPSKAKQNKEHHIFGNRILCMCSFSKIIFILRDLLF